jgi:threonine dehydrogenase-like Zn-dependent dehydrogenase
VTCVAFTAPEYQADGTIAPADYAFAGDVDTGWEITRAGRLHLTLGPGYRVLRTARCGVCATDLARRHLPFPLPHVIGHEVLAHDDAGGLAVVEINASHRARALATPCPTCDTGLDTHCPERLVLGIHDLPGGFGPWLLAPRAAVIPVPGGLDPRAATFAEPLAAAVHATTVVHRRPRARIAVLGPRRLGMLVIAALAAQRRRDGARYEILALTRHDTLRTLARTLGADDARDPDALRAPVADVVIDTTGSASGFERALGLAREEVHLKSTCGTPAAGLAHVTAMVVDELAICAAGTDVASPFGSSARSVSLAGDVPASVVATLAAQGLRIVAASDVTREPLGGVDVVVAASLADVDCAIRPTPGDERGLVRPRGLLVLAPGDTASPLASAILERGLVVTTSRCGDLRSALALLPSSGDALVEHLVTDELPASRLGDAMARAAAPSARKVVVTHPDLA